MDQGLSRPRKVFDHKTLAVVQYRCEWCNRDLKEGQRECACGCQFDWDQASYRARDEDEEWRCTIPGDYDSCFAGSRTFDNERDAVERARKHKGYVERRKVGPWLPVCGFVGPHESKE